MKLNALACIHVLITNNLITKCASQCYSIWILPHIISLSYLMCIKEEFPKTKISNACIHTLFHIIYNYGKKIFWKILTQSDYMWWYFWKIACILICIIDQFRANFSYRFSSAIYYTLNLSLDFLVTLNLYTTLLRCFFFLVLILSHYKCMPPAHPLYVVMTTVIGLLCFTVLYLYWYFDP